MNISINTFNPIVQRLYGYTKPFLTVILLLALFIALYHGVLSHLIEKWRSPDGSYGPLILAVSIYLIWIKRDVIRNLPVQPAMLPGGLLLGAGCFMFFAGQISYTIVVQHLSIVPVMLGIILMLGGYSYFRILFLPVGYLVFLSGIVEMLLSNFTIYMQLFTAYFSTQVFKIIGFPVFQDNIMIMLPHISLEVVRACAGMSHIVALLALAVPLAYLTQRTFFRKVLLIGSAAVIGLFANGLRVVLIGVYALYNQDADIHGPMETLYTTFIFFFGMVLLVLLSRILGRGGGEDDPEGSSPEDGNKSKRISPDENHGAPSTVHSPFIVAVIILLLTIVLSQFYTPRAIPLSQPLDNFPRQVAGYTGTDLENFHDQLRPFPADEELLRRYENENGSVFTVYIGYFQIQDRHSKVIDYRRGWMHEESSRRRLPGEGATRALNKTRMTDEGGRQYIYFGYYMDGRIITNRYIGKFITFFNSLIKRKTNGAVIVIATDIMEDDALPVVETFANEAKRYLSI